jgi:hypothetical protein
MEIDREIAELRMAENEMLRVASFLEGMRVARPDDKELERHAEFAWGAATKCSTARIGINTANAGRQP